MTYYATRSCDAVTTILSYFMNTNGGPHADAMASQVGGMKASDSTSLGNYCTAGGPGDIYPPNYYTGDVGLPGVKYLALYISDRLARRGGEVQPFFPCGHPSSTIVLGSENVDRFTLETFPMSAHLLDVAAGEPRREDS
jgi:hypothetical protein